MSFLGKAFACAREIEQKFKRPETELLRLYDLQLHVRRASTGMVKALPVAETQLWIKSCFEPNICALLVTG